MNVLRPAPGCRRCFPWLKYVLVLMAAWQVAAAAVPGYGGGTRAINIAAYRAHLEKLDALVTACKKLRNGAACSGALIGADDRVQLVESGREQARDVRYGWLRDLLDRAGKKEESAAVGSKTQGKKEQEVSVDTLLVQARQRLSDDWAEAGIVGEAVPSHDAERRLLNSILAGKQFHNVGDSSARERFLEWFANVLDHLFSKLVQLGARSPWIALALRALLLGGVCAGLVWALIRIERRSRIKLDPEPMAVSGAPSAREWQLWLADANTMAEQDLWREAIHFLYWAAIARLESRGLWPVDRARTPREYLSLLPASDARRPNLANLTRSFERTWYGGRQADLADYEAALKQASVLGVK